MKRTRDDHSTLTDVEVGEGIALLVRSCDRVCVHSVAQWETIVVAANGDLFLGALEALCTSLEIGFTHASSEKPASSVVRHPRLPPMYVAQGLLNRAIAR